MGKKRGRAAALTLLCLAVCAAGPARAGAPAPPCSAARGPRAFLQECRRKAQAAAEAGRPREALAIYREAYRQVPSPRLLWPIANLHLALRQPAEGLDALARYLHEMPPAEVPPGQYEEADRLQRRLEQLLQEPPRAQRPPEEPRPAPPRPRPRPTAAPPPAAPPPALPLVPVAAPPGGPPDERPPARFRVWKWATLGLGLALAGSGAGLWAVDGTPTCDSDSPQTSCPKVLRTGPAGVALLSLGAAAVVGGVVLFSLDARRPRRAPEREKLAWKAVPLR